MYRMEYATPKDARELYDLQKLAFLSEAEMTGSNQIPALMERYEDFLKEFGSWTVLVLRGMEERILGAVRYRKEGKKIEVGRLMVHPDWRKRGLASQMMKKIEEGAEGEYLELFTCTKSYTNIRLYETLGYRQEEVVEKGELSIVYMRKEKERKERTILIVNDDGIAAEGIRKLAETARKFGKIWVVAPDGPCSAMSHRIIITREIRGKEYSFPVEGVQAFACDGTPADCIRMAFGLMPEKPDVVLSGINYGYNISWDIQYSATVGAALEAAFWGVPAIAFSREACKCEEVQDAYLEKVLGELLCKPLGNTEVWNVNFPGCTREECKGILWDCQVSRDPFYTEEYVIRSNEDGSGQQFRVDMKRNWEGSEGTDLRAVIDHYVSVGIVHNIW